MSAARSISLPQLWQAQAVSLLEPSAHSDVGMLMLIQ